MAEDLRNQCVDYLPTHIVGIESRGFVLGAALSQELDIFCYDLKKVLNNQKVC